MDTNVRRDNHKKGLHDVRSSFGACNFYRRHIKNLTYTSAILTDAIKKSTTWRWGPEEQQAFDEAKGKVATTKHLGFWGRYISVNGPVFYLRVPQCFFGSYASHYVYYIQ